MESPDSSFLGRNQFLIYRLFSLAGLVPIGGYLVVHLLTNATVLDSPAAFQSQVDRIHSLGILLPLVEWTFIFIPILFHATIGLVIISGGMPNTNSYPYSGNIRYTLQRATGMIAFVFIIGHVVHLHHLGSAVGGGQFDPHAASSSTAAALAPLWLRAAYAVGVLACVYHLANGLWTQGITWGMWTSVPAMRRAGYFCTAFGIGLAAVGLAALYGMSSVDVDQARSVEERMDQQRKWLSRELDTPPPAGRSATEQHE